MARSLALGLYLFLAEHRRAGTAAVRPERPEGPVLWLHAATEAQRDSVALIARLLVEARPGLALLVTGMVSPPDDAILDSLPLDSAAEVRAFLAHWRPAAALFVGAAVPPLPVAEAHARDIPLLMVDAGTGDGDGGLWRRGMDASLLSRFDRILATDAGSLATLRRRGGRRIAVELGGRVEEVPEPLRCNEVELADLTERLQARPVWLAVDVPEDEEALVLDAHAHAVGQAHRLLLILVPSHSHRAEALRDRMAERGFVAATRAADDEIDDDVQVLITDGPTELGLWYRLAPLTYLGGTFGTTASGRSPLEPAALGSAVLAGPQAGDHGAAHARLIEARAAVVLRRPEELAGAVAEIIAPDRAATLAHNAWAVSSGGAEVAERIVRLALAAVDAVAARAGAA